MIIASRLYLDFKINLLSTFMICSVYFQWILKSSYWWRSWRKGIVKSVRLGNHGLNSCPLLHLLVVVEAMKSTQKAIITEHPKIHSSPSENTLWKFCITWTCCFHTGRGIVAQREVEMPTECSGSSTARSFLGGRGGNKT